MRKIIVWSRITMDGVLQAPSGPEEDPSNGFKWGGWSRHYWDELMNNNFGKIMTAQAQQWKLTETVLSTTGAVFASYVPDGGVKYGSFIPDKPSEAELARRKKWSRE